MDEKSGNEVGIVSTEMNVESFIGNSIKNEEVTDDKIRECESPTVRGPRTTD